MQEAPPSLAPALSRWSKLAFGVGAIGELVYLGMFNTFIQIYYNQAIGLSNAWIGTAVLLALFSDAVSDPAVGIISDRTRSRFGRRHPFLFLAPIPLGVSLWLIFNPPELLTGKEVLQTSLGQIQLFMWLALWTIISRLCLTLYVIPHLALGGELARTQHERSQIFSINSIFGYATGALLTFIAWSYFLNGETTTADGVTISNHLRAASYGPLSLFACAVVLISVSLCAVGTYPRVKYLSKPADNLANLTLLTFFRKILSTLKNRNYLFLLIGFFFFMISAGLYETFNIFVMTYFWELGPEQIRWVALAALPGVIVGAFMSPILMRRYDRKPVLLVGIFGMVIFTQLVIDLRLLDWLPANGAPIILPLLIGNAFGIAVSLGLASVAVLSMLGDVIDENELVSGLREEGLFYSARAFFAKTSSSVGHFVAGLVLDWFVRMPFEAVPGQLDADIVFRLGFSAGPMMSLAAAGSLLFYAQYHLPRSRHEEIMRELAARQRTRSVVGDQD